MIFDGGGGLEGWEGRGGAVMCLGRRDGYETVMRPLLYEVQSVDRGAIH